jgi:putative ABC transport system substrate-binding protein
MVIPIGRRRFIAALAGGALLRPIAARAQKTPAPVIGYLGAESPVAFASRLRAFRQGLAEAGYVEGRNVAIEFRWAEGQHSRLAALAAELVSRHVNVIVAPGGAPAAFAARSATSSIPIIFEMGGDPVKLGLVESLNRPGGNLTGVASLNVQLSAKRLEFLREVVPAATVVAALVNSTSPTTDSQLGQLRTAASALGVELQVLRASTEQDIDGAFDELRRLRAGGLVIASDTFFATRSEQLAVLTLRNSLPAIHQSRDFAVAGGLMSYGGNFVQSHRQAGIYAGRVLKGEAPANLPVQQVTSVEFLVNLKTASAFRIAFPSGLLARADEVIE